jgi:hypothetical protein
MMSSIAQTNPALLLGGKAPVLFLPWFDLVAMKGLADCFVADGVDHFEFHELVGQQPQTPAGETVGWLLTTEGHHLGFLTGVELALPRAGQERLALQRGFAPQMILTPGPLHSSDTHPENPGDRDIASPASGLVFISKQQGTHSTLSLGTATAGVNQTFQPRTFPGLQLYPVLFGHAATDRARDISQAFYLRLLNTNSLTLH